MPRQSVVGLSQWAGTPAASTEAGSGPSETRPGLGPAGEGAGRILNGQRTTR